jgi:hypothetical protein
MTTASRRSSSRFGAWRCSSYERRHAEELLHIDVKKLGRIQGSAGHRVRGSRRRSPRGGGWEFVHVCVDDATRLAYVEMLADEKAVTAIAFRVARSRSTPHMPSRCSA